MDRSNHYETAFEAYLRDRRLDYVAVDESRRLALDEEPVKSFDFIIYGANGSRYLVDIKGRRYPGSPGTRRKSSWQNWVESEDVEGLERWQESFGSGYRGLLVFSYHLMPGVGVPRSTPDLWYHQGNCYLIRAVTSSDYRQHMRARSPSWGTVHLPSATFRDLVRPLREYTHDDPSISRTAFTRR